jgi:diguanylate cyclase
MSATNLKFPFLNSMSRFARRSLAITLLPAGSWGIYQMFGENGLIAIAVALPLLWALFGGFEQTETLDDVSKEDQQIAQADQLENRINDMLFAAAPDARLALFCLELDSAADVTRRLGEAGLNSIQDRLQMRYASCLRNRDIVFRSGPLHWTIVATPSSKLNLEVAIAQANRLQNIADEPLFVDEDRLYLSSSVGFTVAQKPFKGAHVLLSQAQSALSEAILNGPNSIRAFTPSKANKFAKAPSFHLQDLNGDIDTSLIAWFQPQISTDTGEITGFEALARWQDNNGHIHSPATVLPVLEQHGLMERLTDLTLTQSLKALHTWDAHDLKIDTIGVNFSQTDLENPKLYEKIAWDLDRFEIEPNRLCVEVLESVIAGDADDVIVRNVTRLAEIGCQIDLDDFGTGHSSISTLRRLPVHRLKIDRSFVAKADLDSEQQKMVATILMMAERLDLACLAEGVETLGEQSILAQLGCRYVQGYGIAKPMPLDQTLDWIEGFQDRQLIAPEIGRKTS